VCDTWREFKTFKNWAVTHGYRKGLQIDRIDNDGDYHPGNCRFVTPTENIRNSTAVKLNAEVVREIRRRHIEGATQAELGRRFGVSGSTVRSVVHWKTWRDV